MKYVNFVTADAEFKGAVVKQTKTHISIDIGNGIATLPLEEGTIQKARAPRAKKANAVKTVRVPRVRTSGPSKKDEAIKIYRDNVDAGKAVIIDMFMANLGMSKAGATTYFYNCKKAI